MTSTPPPPSTPSRGSTPSPGSTPSRASTPSVGWTREPLERARFLDGECGPAEAATRERDLAADPAARHLVERERAFLAVVGRAREGLPPLPVGLETRLRARLAADRGEGRDVVRGAPVPRRRVLSWALATAAAAAAWIVWAGVGRGPVSEAAPGATHLAAETLRMALRGSLRGEPGMACGEGAASPYRFPPVARGELRLSACAGRDDSGRSAAVLEPGEGPAAPRGLVAVSWPTKPGVPEVGVTRFEDATVFDVTILGARYWLAARSEFVDRYGSCAACHGDSHAKHENPHRFVERERP